MRIAVVGAGIAGLGCAHLLRAEHEVVVYEAGTRAGGHSDTVHVPGPAGDVPVDMGFIVYNERTYPRFTRLLTELGVATQPSRMSFGASVEVVGLEYRLTSPATMFAQPRSLARPAYLRMLLEIPRFNAAARRLAAADPGGAERSLEEFVAGLGLSDAFRDWFLIPLGSAVWSADPATFLGFPAATYARFMDNHGLLQARATVPWRTISGGSRSYVRALTEPLGGALLLGEPVTAVRRTGAGVEVCTRAGAEVYDRVVVATHSDQALRLIEEPTGAEREVLGSIAYRSNTATLHSDARLLPRAARAWASWNVRVPAASVGAPTLTYWMNSLQSLPTGTDWFVSLNSDELIDPARVVARRTYEHPVFDLRARAAQRRAGEIQGTGGVHYAGSWLHNGFHEDGLRSAHEACARLLAERRVEALA
jgi:predicted NAD/FAD-binding protein